MGNDDDIIRLFKGISHKDGSAGSKVILFTGRCAAHPPNTPFLRNAKGCIRSANCTSILQTLDSGTIHCMKSK
jgi:hypothetical protein